MSYKMPEEKMQLGADSSVKPCGKNRSCNFQKVEYSKLWVDVCAKRPGELGPQIKDSESAGQILLDHAPHMFVNQREYVVGMLLNNRHHLVGLVDIGRGTTTGSMVDPADIVRAAVLCVAKAIIIAHNHPGGSVEPSGDDLALEARLDQASRVVGLNLLDFLVVARNSLGHPVVWSNKEHKLSNLKEGSLGDTKLGATKTWEEEQEERRQAFIEMHKESARAARKWSEAQLGPKRDSYDATEGEESDTEPPPIG